MNHPNHFRLAFYNGEKREFVMAERYLELRKQGNTEWRPHLEYTGLSLMVEGKEWVLPYRGVGAYADLIPQLAAARARLIAGKTALIRTAVDDSAEGIYFLFELEAVEQKFTPTSALKTTSKQVLISLIYIYDEEFFMHYPWPDQNETATRLYQYVENNKEYLLSPAAAASYRFTRVGFPFEDLCAALDCEVKVGDEILTLPQVDGDA
jgi:hypothetical protein